MLKNKIIVLDPGHSGIPDPGACGIYSKESDIAFKIAQETLGVLEKDNAEVYITKEYPNDPKSDELSARTSLANDIGADLFVSIHLNAAGTPKAHGTETFCYPWSTEGYKVASCIQHQLVACLGLTDRGVKNGNLFVLKYTDMPACLTEVCFITNPDEENLINDPKVIKKAALAIAQGIKDYFYTR